MRHGGYVTERGRQLHGNERSERGGPRSELEDEARILERARNGDPRSYERLIVAYQDRVYGLVRRMVRDSALAEELTQDVFIKAFRSLSSFRGDARFTTWLYRIAVNVCYDHRQSVAARTRNKETSLDGPELEGLDLPSRASRPDEVVESTEVASHFRACLNQLDPMYRDAFLLRHQEGLEYEEIADILEISKTNAKVRVHRAREMVLESLRSRGYNV